MRQADLHPEFSHDYDSYQWLVLGESDYRRLAASDVPFKVAEDAGTVQITGYRFDPVADGEPGIAPQTAAPQTATQQTAAAQTALAAGMRAGSGSGADVAGFRLVQFYGPTDDAWLAEQEEAGLAVLQYYPHFTYLVWGTAAEAEAGE